MVIKPTNKIYLNKSLIHGYGVFTSQPIEEGETIEICPVIDMGMSIGESSHILIDYRFNWPQGPNPEKQVIAAGYAMMYNHSDTPNANWRSNYSENCFEFYATKKIESNEEIFVWYGDQNYWNDGRTHTVIV
jgi:uncharacterized protein